MHAMMRMTHAHDRAQCDAMTARRDARRARAAAAVGGQLLRAADDTGNAHELSE